MAAGIYNFTIEQGATFTRTFKYKDSNGDPLDISEATALRMQIRESINSDVITGGTFGLSSGFTIETPVGQTTQNQFTLVITSAVTAAFTFDRAIYDIELVNQGVTTRLLQGKIKLSKEVTR